MKVCMWAYEFKKFLPRKVHTMTWLTGANVDCDHCRVGTAWYRAWCRHYDATHRDAGPRPSRGREGDMSRYAVRTVRMGNFTVLK